MPLDLFQPSLKELNEKHHTGYRVIQSGFDLQKLCSQLPNKISVDLETTGLNPFKDKVVGVSLSWKDGIAAYVPIGHLTDEAQIPRETTVGYLKPILEDKQQTLIFHNAKFDLQFLLNLGIDPLQNDRQIRLSYYFPKIPSITFAGLTPAFSSC